MKTTVSFLIIILQIVIILCFENCQTRHQAFPFNVERNIKDFASSVQGGGNGDSYDGKLTFVISYKEQLFYENKVKMYSGETMTFTINGGEEPYSFQVQGTGVFNQEIQSYTTGYFNNSPVFEKIIVTDKNNNSGVITVEIHSFLGATQVLYPPKESHVSVSKSTQLLKHTNGTIYQVLGYQNWQEVALTVIRQSDDGGQTWVTIKEFQVAGKLFLNPFVDQEFYFISGYLIYKSSDTGKTWNKVNSSGIYLEGKSFLIRDLKFISETKILATGSLNSANSSNNPVNHMSLLLSEDGGKNWQQLDYFFDSNKFSRSSGKKIIIMPTTGEIFVFGEATLLNNSGSIWFVRRSVISHLSEWTTDLIYDLEVSGYPYNNLNSVVSDEGGNLFVNGKSGAENNFEDLNFKILKRSKSDGAWTSMTFDETIQSGIFYLSPKNKLYLLVSQNIDGNLVSQLYRSEDLGLSWVNISKFDNINPHVQHLIFLNDGKMMVSGLEYVEHQYLSFLAVSNDEGHTWQKVNSFKPLNISAGDFIATDFLEIKPGVLFMAGYGKNPTFQRGRIWIVKQSMDNGKTWVDRDLFEGHSRTFSTIPYSMIKDPSNNIYVLGKKVNRKPGNFQLLYNEWVVRKSSDQGLTWNTVDEQSPQLKTITTAARNTLKKSIKGYNRFKGTKLVRLEHRYDSPRLGYSAIKASINSTGDSIFVLGNQIELDPNDDTKIAMHAVVKKSTDEGKNWQEVDRYGTQAEPLLIQSCFNDVVFTISKDADKNIFRRSDDQGKTWRSISIRGFDHNDMSNTLKLRRSNIISGNILCAGADEVSFFMNKKNLNGVQNKIIHYTSSDKGLTWKSQELELEPKMKGDFTLNSFISDGNFFWLAGSIFYKRHQNIERFGHTNWAILRVNKDLSNPFIVDHFRSPTLESAIIKLDNCENGICSIGYCSSKENSNFYSVFRSIEKK